MFPETFVVRACFPNISQFCHTRNIVTTFASEKQNMFPQHGRNIPCFRDAWKACFPMFPSFATNGNIMSARLRNVATFILIKLLYEAVSSADNSLTMVSKAPLSFLLCSHNRLGPFFRFPVRHLLKWPQRPQARHWCQHRLFWDHQVSTKCCWPQSPRWKPIFKSAHAPSHVSGISGNMFPRLVR